MVIFTDLYLVFIGIQLGIIKKKSLVIQTRFSLSKPQVFSQDGNGLKFGINR